jgi:hypothetical protein
VVPGISKDCVTFIFRDKQSSWTAGDVIVRNVRITLLTTQHDTPEFVNYQQHCYEHVKSHNSRSLSSCVFSKSETILQVDITAPAFEAYEGGGLFIRIYYFLSMLCTSLFSNLDVPTHGH